MGSISPEVPTVAPSLSDSFLSSTSNPFSTTLLSSTPTETNDNDDNGIPPISRSSSLLFGFLITFLALFIGFMACGYSSRRAARIGGRNYVGRFGNLDRRALKKMKKPRLWDVQIDARSGKDQWKDMMPLSASIIRPGRKDSHPTQSSENVPETPAALREDEPPQEYFPSFYFGSRALGRFGYNYPVRPPPAPPRRPTRLASEPSVSSFMSSLVLPTSDFVVRPSRSPFSGRSRGTTRSKPVEQTTSIPAKHGDSDTRDVQAQVSVLIAMPSPTRTASSSWRNESRKAPLSKDENELVEDEDNRTGQLYYEIGIARVPISTRSGSGGSEE